MHQLDQQSWHVYNLGAMVSLEATLYYNSYSIK